MKNKIKLGSAVVLAVVLMVSALVLPTVYAALGVNTDAKCSVVVSVPTEGFSELKSLPVVINLYKVAEIDKEGQYEPTADFASLDLSSLGSDKTANAWEEKAAAAKELVTEDVEVIASMELSEGTATAGDLPTGLYLVDAQKAESDAYAYEFKPYLISLPNNYFYTSDNDEWVYENVAIGLKPERSDRYGDLIIAKALPVYNETIGGATFVFQVEAVKTDVDTNEEKVVYSDVVSMTFTAPGYKEIRIKDLPAGAEVTVTEVYSGASYELVSEAVQTAVIVVEGTEEEPNETAKVEFENTYNKKFGGGSGVVNTFTYDGESFEWHSTTQSPEEIQNTKPLLEAATKGEID